MPRICITVPDKTPQPYRFPLETEVVSIGRAASNHVVIDHPSISSKHCEMKRMRGGYILIDVGSTNGIHLEKEEMEVIDLKDGMDAKVGDVNFNYQLSEEEAEVISSEKFKKRQRKKREDRVKEAPKQIPKRSDAYPQTSSATPAIVMNKDSSARDFAIFVLFVVLASLSFYWGLNSVHKVATKSEESPYGRSLLKDLTNPQLPAEGEVEAQ